MVFGWESLYDIRLGQILRQPLATDVWTLTLRNLGRVRRGELFILFERGLEGLDELVQVRKTFPIAVEAPV